MNRISLPPLGAPGCYANPICANSISLLPRFALCEASKYFFYLRYESGHLYKPSSRDFDLALQAVSEAERERLRGIWAYWEESGGGIMDTEDELHPDHRI